VEITDAEGKSLLKKDNPLRGLLALGGGRLSGMANVTFGGGAKPGEYTATVTVTNRLSGAKASFQRKLLYQSGGFHIVSPQFFFDAEGKLPAPGGGFVGQTLFLRLKAVGLDPQADRIVAAMTLQILDSSGKAMLPKPLVAVLSEDDSEKAKKIQLLSFNANFNANFCVRPVNGVLDCRGVMPAKGGQHHGSRQTRRRTQGEILAATHPRLAKQRLKHPFLLCTARSKPAEFLRLAT